MTTDYADRRTVCISDPHWMALKLIADLNYTSISAVLRHAAELYVERYGLTFQDGQLTINPLVWPTEILQGDQREISEGDQII